MRIVKSIEELEAALKPTMKNMVDQLSKQVYETLNYFLNDYYTGWTPKVYQRTQDFLHSAVRIKAKEYKGHIQGFVYIDYQNMNDYVNARPKKFSDDQIKYALLLLQSNPKCR